MTTTTSNKFKDMSIQMGVDKKCDSPDSDHRRLFHFFRLYHDSAQEEHCAYNVSCSFILSSCLIAEIFSKRYSSTLELCCNRFQAIHAFPDFGSPCIPHYCCHCVDDSLRMRFHRVNLVASRFAIKLSSLLYVPESVYLYVYI